MRLIPIITTALLLASCGQERDQPVYEGSQFVRVHLLTFTPAHDGMAGKTPVHYDAKVEVIRRGTHPYAISIPGRCHTGPIRQRIGREIMMRADQLRYADGTVRTTIPRIEAIAALCDDILNRDPVRPRRP